MSGGPRTTVTVEIAGEQYSIRTEATPEYARECAELVDRTLADMLHGSAPVEAHKAVVLAALSLADQILQARKTRSELEDQQANLTGKLAADLEAALEPDHLASGR